jgi:hypothetical protein
MSVDYSLVPQDKHDLETAEAAVAAGYPAVEPVLPRLLEWLQDMNWPVVKVLSPFLASIGTPLIPHIRKVFETDDEIWKYWIMRQIMTESIEIAEAFKEDLKRIAYTPNKREIEEELNETALFVLGTHNWQK